MPESIVQVTEGTGKKLHTWQTTVGANAVEDEFVLPGEYPYPTYSITAESVAFAAANDHILQVMAGATNKVRIRRIRVEQAANATTAGSKRFELLRLTTAGTGGTAITPRPYETTDAAAGCTAMTLPGVKGTEGVLLKATVLIFRQAISATAAGQLDDDWEWVQMPGTKPLIIPAGTTNGIVIKTLDASGGGSLVHVNIELVETPF